MKKRKNDHSVPLKDDKNERKRRKRRSLTKKIVVFCRYLQLGRKLYDMNTNLVHFNFAVHLNFASDEIELNLN